MSDTNTSEEKNRKTYEIAQDLTKLAHGLGASNGAKSVAIVMVFPDLNMQPCAMYTEEEPQQATPDLLELANTLEAMASGIREHLKEMAVAACDA